MSSFHRLPRVSPPDARTWSILMLLLALAWSVSFQSPRAGAQQPATPPTTLDVATPACEDVPTAIFNITTGPENLLRLVTALHVAEEALVSGRKVVLFFNAGGVHVPVKRLPQDLRLNDERPVWRILQDLMERGATVIIARHSSDLLGYYPADFIEGARIEPFAGNIFSRVTKDTLVFSY